MKIWLRLTVLVSLFSLFLFPPAERLRAAADGLREDGFTEDTEAALESAKKQNKDLFVLFTGSDWCPPCKSLEAEVLSKPEFLERAQQNFVLLKLDFPKNHEQAEELAKRNQEWSEKYGISGFPTIVVLDRDLRPVGFLGYMEGGPEPFLEALMVVEEKRVRRDEALSKLPAAKTDDERAKLLDEALSQLDEEIISVYYTEERDQIVALDPDNKLELRAKYNGQQDAEIRKTILMDILMVSRLDSPENAVMFIDEVLKEIPFPDDEKFEVLEVKLNLLQQAGKRDAANQLLDEMLTMEGLLPETREHLWVKKVWQFVATQDSDAGLKLIEEALKQPGEHLYLQLTKGQILNQQGKTEDALAAFDLAIPKSRFKPDVLVELVASKADIQFALKREEEALKTLENFVDDSQMPVDLRCESLLHEALMMRDMGRVRPAMLTENRAVELADSPQLKREIQQVIDQIRTRNSSDK